MTVVKQLVEFVVYPIAMGAGAALCLWVLLGPLRIDRIAVAGQGSSPATPDLPPVAGKPPADVPQQGTAATKDLSPVPGDQPARRSGRITSSMEDLPLGRGDSGPLVTQLQGALIKNGYSAGLAGADGKLNDDTLAALEAFQDNNALPVQPSCDQQCWTALGLSRPE